jgi:hypothetical protein
VNAGSSAGAEGASPAPTALVAWAQREPEWTDQQARAWREEVAAFTAALRDFGIDAECDLHRQSERGVDWTRFGARAIAQKDWVIVALSPAWRSRWEGTNTPSEGAGAVAEADALRSIFAEDQHAFHEKLVLALLPSMLNTSKLIPLGLHGVQRRRISDFGLGAMTDLLRLLTGQPEHIAAPLGQIPALPPTPARAPPDTPERVTEPGTEEAPDSASRHPPRRGIWLLPTRELTARELLDGAGRTPGAPEHWSLYDGVLLLRVVAAAQAPEDFRLRGAAVGEALKRAGEAASDYLSAHLRPAATGHLARTLAHEWRSTQPREWSCGASTSSVEQLKTRETSAALLATSPPVLTVDRTLPSAVSDNTGVVYYAAFEPVIAADVIACCALTASLFASARACDIAVMVSAAPPKHGLVSAESYAGNHRPFAEPHEGIRPPSTRAPACHLERTRANLDELRSSPEEVTRRLLDDWLITFRDEDLFPLLRQENVQEAGQ